jgi:hypothetical protein
MSNQRHVRECVTCGDVHICDSHHPARRENNAELTFPVGVKEHVKYLTPRQNNTALTPGVRKTAATLAGVTQMIALACQQQEQWDDATSVRRLATLPGNAGKPRNNRVPKQAGEQDDLSLTARTARLVSSALIAAGFDTQCPVDLKPFIMLQVRFFDAVAERPRALRDYMTTHQAALPPSLSNNLGLMQHRSVQQLTEHALDDFAAIETAMIDFLRWSRQQDTARPLVVVTA